MAESIGVEGRGAFYESAGAFRDVMQNHMFMLLALIAMEPPTSLEGEAIGTKGQIAPSIHFRHLKKPLWTAFAANMEKKSWKAKKCRVSAGTERESQFDGRNFRGDKASDR